MCRLNLYISGMLCIAHKRSLLLGLYGRRLPSCTIMDEMSDFQGHSSLEHCTELQAGKLAQDSTSQHFVVIPLKVMDCTVRISDQRLDGLGPDVELCAGDMVQAQPGHARPNERSIQQQRQQDNASCPQSYLRGQGRVSPACHAQLDCASWCLDWLHACRAEFKDISDIATPALHVPGM